MCHLKPSNERMDWIDWMLYNNKLLTINLLKKKKQQKIVLFYFYNDCCQLTKIELVQKHIKNKSLNI